jgi:hypothetical protein
MTEGGAGVCIVELDPSGKVLHVWQRCMGTPLNANPLPPWKLELYTIGANPINY